MKKQLKRALCTGLAGGLLLGCLTGCGDEKKPTAEISVEVTSVLQEKVVFSGPEDRACTSYVIPEGVTEIGTGAFSDCSSLTSIEIPNSVTKICADAFAWCSALTSIEIPTSVTKIDVQAFIGCGTLTGIEIPNSVTEIGDEAFMYCGSLTSIGLPNSVTEIGNGAFRNCSSLTSIEIPDSVTEIGTGAFSGCSALTSIEIPSSVTEIGDNAFSDCSALTSIEIPNSVTKIGFRAFFGCSALTSIEIPDSVTEIGEDAFWGCDALETVKVPQGMDVSSGLGAEVQLDYRDVYAKDFERVELDKDHITDEWVRKGLFYTKYTQPDDLLHIEFIKEEDPAKPEYVPKELDKEAIFHDNITGGPDRDEYWIVNFFNQHWDELDVQHTIYMQYNPLDPGVARSYTWAGTYGYMYCIFVQTEEDLAKGDNVWSFYLGQENLYEQYQ